MVKDLQTEPLSAASPTIVCYRVLAMVTLLFSVFVLLPVWLTLPCIAAFAPSPAWSTLLGNVAFASSHLVIQEVVIWRLL